MSQLQKCKDILDSSISTTTFSRGAIRGFLATERHAWQQELDSRDRRIAELEGALEKIAEGGLPMISCWSLARATLGQNIPIDDEPLTEEDVAAIEKAEAEPGPFYSLEEVRAMLAAKRQKYQAVQLILPGI